MPAVNPNATPVAGPTVTPSQLALPFLRIIEQVPSGKISLVANLSMVQANQDGTLTQPTPPINGNLSVQDLAAEIALVAEDTANNGPAVAASMNAAVQALLTALAAYANYKKVTGFTGLTVQ